MANPISELIAQNILTTVQGVTAGNGYNYTLTAERHKRSGDKRQHLNAVIIQDDPSEVTPGVYNCKEWLLPFAIGVFVIPVETDTTPIDQYCNLIRADVEKALMVDRYRGGNALDTIIKPSKMIAEEGLEYDCIVINVDVDYRTSELDPYINAR